MSEIRSTTRSLIKTGLLRSPEPIRHAVQRGASRLSAALAEPVPAAAQQPEQSVWQPRPVPVPDGLTVQDIDRMFRTWAVNGEPAGHLDGYVSDSLLRFLQTWSLVRDLKGSCLELGANPYFTTQLLDDYTELELELANYYGHSGTATETVSYIPAGEFERRELTRTCRMFNVEEDEFPYDDDSFDVVMFCEMLEHLLMDPCATLRQIHRVLKPGGTLVLTTPNVARLDNLMAMVHGTNIYDPYSGFGPYGRHNREYTRHEVHRLLDFLGFEVDESFTADGHPYDPNRWPRRHEADPLVGYRREDLGHYLFVRASAVREPREGLPSFLYRSWPPGHIVDFA